MVHEQVAAFCLSVFSRFYVLCYLAGRGHVGVDAEERAAAEAEVIHAGELAVEPKVQVDDGDALELVELAEEGLRLPLLGHVALEDVHGHGAHVVVRLHLGPVAHLQVLHAAGVVGDDLLDGHLRLDAAALGLDEVLVRLAHAVALAVGCCALLLRAAAAAAVPGPGCELVGKTSRRPIRC